MAVALHVEYNPEIHQTIDYGNMTAFLEKIETNENLTEQAKQFWRYIAILIDMNKVFYANKEKKISWVKNIDTPLLTVMSQLYQITINTPTSNYMKINDNTRYYIYCILVTFISLLDNIMDGIDFIYSDKCRSKKIKQHPGFGKGKDYYYSAIVTIRHMLFDLYMTHSHNKETIFSEFDTKNIKVNDKLTNHIQQLQQMFDNTFTISGLLKKEIDDIPEEERQTRYTQMNVWVYINILNILTPCNCFTLMFRFYKYYYRLQQTRYLYKLINNFSNPEYLKLNINLS